MAEEFQHSWWSAIGSLQPLQQKKLALFSSVSCPGELLIKSYDLAQLLRRHGVAVVSGFHSPIEKSCFDILVCGLQPVIIVAAKSLPGLRIPAEHRRSLHLDRLLYLSPFSQNETRISAKSCFRRNRVVAALADVILFIHARPGSKSHCLFQKLCDQQRRIFVLQSEFNRHLLDAGALPLDLNRFEPWLTDSGLAAAAPPSSPQVAQVQDDKQICLF
ncbi:DNA-processing protein DprA [candidate division KSB1 bacterium]|nr:DNA-processing protein DprA [candidate division KSB1 bacterium]